MGTRGLSPEDSHGKKSTRDTQDTSGVQAAHTDRTTRSENTLQALPIMGRQNQSATNQSGAQTPTTFLHERTQQQSCPQMQGAAERTETAGNSAEARSPPTTLPVTHAPVSNKGETHSMPRPLNRSLDTAPQNKGTDNGNRKAALTNQEREKTKVSNSSAQFDFYG